VSATGQERGTSTDQPAPAAPPRRVRAVWIIVAVILTGAVMWGGYSHHWSWTGINGHTATLWDWLHLVLLPLAVIVLPLWLHHRTQVARSHKAIAVALLALWAVVVILGYTVPWPWTGFQGNTLWDWLKLVALPVAVASVPLYRDLHARWAKRHTVVSAIGLGLFVVAVLGGYLGSWAWTGFAGNTLWDWLQLLLLPLLLPTILVPSLRPLVTAGVIFLDAEEDSGDPEGGSGGSASAA
jgi:hypothetical protein